MLPSKLHHNVILTVLQQELGSVYLPLGWAVSTTVTPSAF